MSNIGMNLVEVNGRASPSIQGAPTSVAGFVIRSERGVPGAVSAVTNLAELREIFGGFVSDAYGAYVLRGFFDNGGTLAYVTRVVNTTDRTGQKKVAIAATKALPAKDGSPSLTVTAGRRGTSDPGAWGKDLSVQVRANGRDATAFDLVIKHRARVVETWEGLVVGGSGEKDPRRLNDVFSGSKYVTVTVDAAAKANPDATKATDGGAAALELLAGEDDNLGTAALASDLDKAIQAAFSLFDTYEIQLLASPESSSAEVVKEALTYCEVRGDCMFVGHTPSSVLDASSAKQWVDEGKLRQDKAYGALYFPFVLVSDPIGTQKWIPPTGHVMGVYARTDRERGVWKAPAGNAAHLAGVLDVKARLTDTAHTDMVKNASVNAVRYISGLGIVVDSSRTLSTSTLWLYVNVRLLFNFVKTSLRQGLRWVVQEPNDATLWAKVKHNTVTPFLMGLWRRGAFGPGSPEEVFAVKVDGSNNSPADVQQGIFNVEVYFYPSRPAETIVITVGQQEGGSQAGEG